jgi:CPA2 family monovalent cation:H+ antiporter-2
MIKRETHTIVNPKRNEYIFPGDEIFVIGTELQVQKLKVLFRNNELPSSEEPAEVEPFSLQLSTNHFFSGKSIRETGIREATDILVVGIEREEERILNPPSDFELHAKDRMLLVGNKKKLDAFILSRTIT